MNGRLAALARRIKKNAFWCKDLLSGKPMVACGRVFTRLRIAGFVLLLFGLGLVWEIGARLTWQVFLAGTDARLCIEDVLITTGPFVDVALASDAPLPPCWQYVEFQWWQFLPYDSQSLVDAYWGGFLILLGCILVYAIVVRKICRRYGLLWWLFPTVSIWRFRHLDSLL